MRFIEDAKIVGTRRTKDGYLVADVKVARTGIQQYLGSELGKPELSVVNVYRPEDAVFATDSLATYAGKPVTDNHPAEPVTAKNWKQLAGGSIGHDIARDGEFVRVPIMLMDGALIDKVENGKRETSMGYDMELSWEDGTAPCGTEYQAVMRNLRMNHVAIVDRGRAGKECRVGDGAVSWGVAPINATDKEGKSMADTKTRTVLIDGIPVDVTDASAAVIDKLTKQRDQFESTLADTEKAHEVAIAAKDKELAAKDAEIDKLKSEKVDDAAIDKRIADRCALIDSAKKVAKDIDFKGMSDAEIRKAAVVAVRGADSVKDKSEAYIEAAFDMAVEAGGATKANDSVRQAVQARDVNKAADNGQAAYEQRIRDAYKSSENGKAA